MPPFVDVRDPDDKLLFRYDAERALIEIQRRGRKRIVDLEWISNKQHLDKPCLDDID